MKAILLSTVVLALVACKRDDVPAKNTTTTSADVPATPSEAQLKPKEPEPPKQCMNCDAGFTDSTEPKDPNKTTGSIGHAPADPARGGGAAPSEPLGTGLVPRSGSASEAAGNSGNRGAGSGLFGPSLVPAPAAPTSPAGEVNGAGGVSGTGGTTGTGGTMGTGGAVGGTHGGGTTGTGGAGMTGGTAGGSGAGSGGGGAGGGGGN